MSTPRSCRRDAYELFREQVARLDQPDALWRAAVAISLHELPEVDVEEVDAQIQKLANRIRGRVQSGQPMALLAQAHEVLFTEEEFRGNVRSYYAPSNSYLPRVLETRRGIPITLCLIYKTVLDRIGLHAHGINAPGHFLVQAVVAGDTLTVDPFHRGKVLSPTETIQRIETVLGTPLPPDQRNLTLATPRLWLSRILRNLVGIFANIGRSDDLRAMRELQQALEFPDAE